MEKHASSVLAEEAIRDGDPIAALAKLEEAVRREPTQARLRIFLFQLLALLGHWERALTQLNVLQELDPAALPMVYTYQTALPCEALRAEVFHGTRSPLVFGEPQHWMGLLLEALRLTADNQHQASQVLRNDAFQEAPATAGTIDGEDFAWIADMDSRLGPMLEAFINGQYYWIPFQYVQQIVIEEPVDLRDLVWMPANFTWANGGQSVGLIPTRYPGSESSENNQIRMARRTEWHMPADDLYLGQGQRMFATDSGEYPLMDIRHVKFNPASDVSLPVA